MNFMNVFPKILPARQPTALEVQATQVIQKQFQDLAAEWSEETRFTPDILKIQRKILIPVFIPDEVMSTKAAFHVIAPGGKMMHAFTKEGYLMLKKETKRFASVVVFEEAQVRGGHGMLTQLVNAKQVVPAQVRGELHMLTPEQLISLDYYKENGVKFRRKRIVISIPHKYKKQTDEGGIYYTPLTSKDYSAYMYIANYEEHFEHWHMTDLKRVLASLPLIPAKVPYYYNL